MIKIKVKMNLITLRMKMIVIKKVIKMMYMVFV